MSTKLLPWTAFSFSWRRRWNFQLTLGPSIETCCVFFQREVEHDLLSMLQHAFCSGMAHKSGCQIPRNNSVLRPNSHMNVHLFVVGRPVQALIKQHHKGLLRPHRCRKEIAEVRRYAKAAEIGTFPLAAGEISRHVAIGKYLAEKFSDVRARIIWIVASHYFQRPSDLSFSLQGLGLAHNRRT